MVLYKKKVIKKVQIKILSRNFQTNYLSCEDKDPSFVLTIANLLLFLNHPITSQTMRVLRRKEDTKI